MPFGFLVCGWWNLDHFEIYASLAQAFLERWETDLDKQSLAVAPTIFRLKILGHALCKSARVAGSSILQRGRSRESTPT